MKFTSLGIVSISAFLIALPLSTASAADMAVKAPPAPPPEPVCTWCGWYIGLNAGWFESTRNTFTDTGTDTSLTGLGSMLAAGGLPGSVDVRMDGFIGGGQVGYNWQIGTTVFGIEGDFDGASASSNHAVFFPGSAVILPNTSTFARRLDWLSTVRGRLGTTITPSLLLYVTGGVAFGESRIGNSDTCPIAEPSCFNTTQHVSAGGTVGVGAEWMFAPHWSVKAEYLFADLGRQSSTIFFTSGANTSSMTSTMRDEVNIARGGINWHF